MIVPEADAEQFVMSDVGNGTHGSKTPPRQSRQPSRQGSLTNVALKDDDLPLLFSSPQNRRVSMMKSSVKSKKSRPPSLDAMPEHSSIGGRRGGDGINGAINSRKHDGVDSLTSEDGVVPLVPTTVTTVTSTSIDLGKSGKPRLNGSIKSSGKTVKEVLGALPILLVDDSVSILKLTKRAIQNECADISFMEAKNGEEAYERVVEAFTSFELIITDIQMPICNGFDFTRRVRQLERDKGLIPKLIIGISANDQQKISIEAKESGMYLPHPIFSSVTLFVTFPFFESLSNLNITIDILVGMDGFMHKPFKLTTLMDVIDDISSRRRQVNQPYFFFFFFFTIF